MSEVFTLHQGASPLLVSVPHAGTHIPSEMRSLFTDKALEVADTDWHLDVLYDYVKTQNASLLVPQHSRYVIDLNRPPDGAAMYSELARIKALHGYAVLFDGHSIKSQVPWLFEGTLPDLNIGTANGASCAANLREGVAQWLAGQSDFSHVMDGRFKGGYITRQYGRPEQGIHAVQLEMCWSTYMQESPPYVLNPQRQARIHPLLQGLTSLLATVVPHG